MQQTHGDRSTYFSCIRWYIFFFKKKKHTCEKSFSLPLIQLAANIVPKTARFIHDSPSQPSKYLAKRVKTQTTDTFRPFFSHTSHPQRGAAIKARRVVLRFGVMGVVKGAVDMWGPSGGGELRVMGLACLITGTKTGRRVCVYGVDCG